MSRPPDPSNGCPGLSSALHRSYMHIYIACISWCLLKQHCQRFCKLWHFFNILGLFFGAYSLLFKLKFPLEQWKCIKMQNKIFFTAFQFFLFTIFFFFLYWHFNLNIYALTALTVVKNAFSIWLASLSNRFWDFTISKRKKFIWLLNIIYKAYF